MDNDAAQVVEQEFGHDALDFLDAESKTSEWNVAAVSSVSLKGIPEAEAESIASVSIRVTDLAGRHELLRCTILPSRFRQRDSSLHFTVKKQPFPLLAVPAAAGTTSSDESSSSAACGGLLWTAQCHYNALSSSSAAARSGGSVTQYRAVGRCHVPGAPPAPTPDQTVTAWTAKLTLGPERSRRGSAAAAAAAAGGQDNEAAAAAVRAVSTWTIQISLRIRRLLPLPFVYELEPPQADYVALCTMVAASHVPFRRFGAKASIGVTRQRARRSLMDSASANKRNSNNTFADPLVELSDGAVQESPPRFFTGRDDSPLFSPQAAAGGGSPEPSRGGNPGVSDSYLGHDQQHQHDESSNHNVRETIGVWGGMRGRWVYSYTDEDDVDDVLRFSIRETEFSRPLASGGGGGSSTPGQDLSVLSSSGGGAGGSNEEIAIGRLTLGDLATEVTPFSSTVPSTTIKADAPSPGVGSGPAHRGSSASSKNASPTPRAAASIPVGGSGNNNKNKKTSSSSSSPRVRPLPEEAEATAQQQHQQQQHQGGKNKAPRSHPTVDEKQQQQQQQQHVDNNEEDEVPELLLVVRNGALWPPLRHDGLEGGAGGANSGAGVGADSTMTSVSRSRDRQGSGNGGGGMISPSRTEDPRQDSPPVPHSSAALRQLAMQQQQQQQQLAGASPTPHARQNQPPRPEEYGNAKRDLSPNFDTCRSYGQVPSDLGPAPTPRVDDDEHGPGHQQRGGLEDDAVGDHLADSGEPKPRGQQTAVIVDDEDENDDTKEGSPAAAQPKTDATEGDLPPVLARSPPPRMPPRQAQQQKKKERSMFEHMCKCCFTSSNVSE